MTPVAGLVRIDARNVRRDPLLGVVLLSPLLLALALRAGYPAMARWAAATHGLHLGEHRGFVLAFVVVLHVAFAFGMLGALLVLDDVDDRTLLALRVTPITVEGYLGYRLAGVAMGAVLGLAVAVPLSGLVARPSFAVVPALLLAAACAPLVTLATLALAGNKVEGVAVVKLLGLPVYAPLLTWFNDGTWTGALGLLPTYWPVRALWAGLDGRIDTAGLVVGALYVGAITVLLRRRVLRRL